MLNLSDSCVQIPNCDSRRSRRSTNAVDLPRTELNSKFVEQTIHEITLTTRKGIFRDISWIVLISGILETAG